MPKRIDHVAIIVRNIEQALAFYRDTLGIIPSEIKEVPTEQVRIAFLPLGGPGGSEIELIEPITSDSSLARFWRSEGKDCIISASKLTILMPHCKRCKRKMLPF